MFLSRLTQFNPDTISGLRGWIDASRVFGIANGGNIVTVPELARVPTVRAWTAGGTVPTFQNAGLCDRPTIRFGGGGSLKRGTDVILSDDEFTLFVVLSGAVQVNKAIVSQNSSGVGRTNFLGTDGSVGTLARIFFNNGSTQTLSSVDTLFNSKPHVVMTRSDGAGFWTVSVDGGQENADITGQVVTPSAVAFTIGGGTDGATFFTGDISEVLIYNKNLTPDNVARVTRYLARKWKLKYSAT